MRKLKKGSLFLFAASAFGPNLMMTLVTAYLNDALLAPAGLAITKTFTGSILISAGLSSVLFFLARLIDGVIDVPLAHFSDGLKSKFGKRRTGILLGWVPMVVSFVLIWSPQLFQGAGAVGLSWIDAVLLLVFYSSYTLCLLSYYATFSSIVEDDKSRLKLTHYKAFFDTVQYAIAYALFPTILLTVLGGKEAGAVGNAVLKLAPLMLTMLIPIFLLKENEEVTVEENKPGLVESIKISLRSKPFKAWLLTQFFLHIGLMLFLTAIGTTIPDALMGLGGKPWWMVTVMNSAAFAPVPLMLWIFSRVKKRRGTRFSLQTALIVFALAMFGFAFSWVNIWGGNFMMSFYIGITAATLGSYGIGVFFSMSYFLPSQIAAREIKSSGKDVSAMYFAVQGLMTAVAGAIGVNLIYMNLVNENVNFPLFGMPNGNVFLVPVLSGIFLLLSFLVSFRMDKDLGQPKA